MGMNISAVWISLKLYTVLKVSDAPLEIAHTHAVANPVAMSMTAASLLTRMTKVESRLEV